MSEQTVPGRGPATAPESPEYSDGGARTWLRRAAQRGRHSQLLPLLVLWGVVVAYFGLHESRYLSEANITSVVEQKSVLFVVAMLETVILLCGAVDLSAGGMVGLTGLLLTLGNSGTPAWLVILITILAGGLLSAVCNGLPIGFVKMNPFVVTLGTSTIFLGAANLLTGGGETKILEHPQLINSIVSDKIGPIPIEALIMLAVVLGIWGMLRFTYFGRNVYAVGGNAEAATLAGISVARIKIAAFMLLGFAAGAAAVLQAGQLSSVAPTAGSGLELEAIAAVLLGGTALGGGRGGVIGTAVAVLFLGSLQNGLDISGVSSFWQQVVTGTVLVVAVGFDQVRKELAARRSTRIAT
jgi:ribose/xylose/arabinose/galactoside ABC-type transport system permease subunit